MKNPVYTNGYLDVKHTESLIPLSYATPYVSCIETKKLQYKVSHIELDFMNWL